MGEAAETDIPHDESVRRLIPRLGEPARAV
jgi:hypothetical protein